MKKNLIKVISVLLLFSSCTFTVAERVIQHEAFSASDVKNIKVEASSGDVKVIPGNSAKIIVETYSNKLKVSDVDIDLDGDTLSVDATNWSMSKYPPNVRIFVPRDFLFEDLRITISSGSVDVEDIECDNLLIKASSGSIDVDNVDLTGNLNITSTSGSVDADEVYCERFYVNVTSGSVEADDISCDLFEANSSSGKIEVEDLNCQSFSAESTSGRIAIELNEMITENSSMKATSGTIVLTLPNQNPGYAAIVNTNSGRFTDEFTGVKATNCNGLTSVYRSGDVEIELSAKSGNVKIERRR